MVPCKLNQCNLTMYISNCIIISFIGCGQMKIDRSYEEVGKSEGNYLKFNIPSSDLYGTEKVSQQTITYGLYVSVKEEDSDWVFFKNINPPPGYWRRYYSDYDILPRAVKYDMRFFFISGCEYQIPLPVGKYLYRISIASNENGWRGELREWIQLKRGESIIISIDKGSKDISEQLANDGWQRMNRYHIRYSIVETEPQKEVTLCL